MLCCSLEQMFPHQVYLTKKKSLLQMGFYNGDVASPLSVFLMMGTMCYLNYKQAKKSTQEGDRKTDI